MLGYLDFNFQIAKLKEERKINILCKDKLSRMEEERDEFIEILVDRREEIFLVFTYYIFNYLYIYFGNYLSKNIYNK